MVQGDDFVSSCERSELEWLCRSLQTFETKIKMMGVDDDLDEEARVLNRIVRWHPRQGIAREADPRHAEIISRKTGAGELKTIFNTGSEGNRT